MIFLDYFSSQTELRSPAAEVSVNTASQELVTSPTSVSQEEGASDSNYQTFHIHAPSVRNALAYSRNTLCQMLTNLQDDQCCSCKLACHETLHHSLLCVSASSEPKKLTYLYKVDSCLNFCTFKLDLSLFLNSVTPGSYSVLCMLNDTGVGMKERFDLNVFMHEGRKRFTICNMEDGFHDGLVNTDAGFKPGYVTYVSSTMAVLYSCEEDVEGSTVPLLEFCNTGLVECVGRKSWSVLLGCILGNFGASASGSYCDLGGSKQNVLQVV
jgi:hypothetical protein